jgi:tetratricopeptide (TPR) repeat protein
MRRMAWLLATLALTAASAALAQAPRADAPAACRPDVGGGVDWRACADAAPADSAPRRLALINLGTQAFLRDDYAAAVAFYDQAQPSGEQQIFSDASFHAFRSASYRHVGRAAEALADARTALDLLVDPADLPPQARQIAAAPVDVELVYSLILPPLRQANDPRYLDAFYAYRALPARDWISLSRRAAVFEELGDRAAALEASAQAVALKPDEPAVLNNHCYALARAGRGTEALAFCERAIRLAPAVAPIRDSYAVALAAAGQCSRARDQLAEAQRLDPTAVIYRRTLECRPT